MEPEKPRRSAVHTREYQFLLKKLREARVGANLTQVEVANAP